MERIEGGVTVVKGFKASGVHAGIKAGSTKRDIALIYSEFPAVAAGVFTLNKVKAAPLIVTQERLAQKPFAQAVVVNSGNANACTGEQGIEDAKEMAALVAQGLGIEEDLVMVTSTGVIGVNLPMEVLRKGIPLAVAELNEDGGALAAEAIMTTDLFAKEYAAKTEIGGQTVTFGAMAKGSGMIHPNMATMLGFITTDAKISPEALQVALKAATAASFNMISVDGDTSTNDMVVVMANGLAGNKEINLGTSQYDEFLKALTEVCVQLSKAIARDGEGATKLLEVQVKGAPKLEDARKAAMAVIKSSLVKTAIHGEDANWGRILAAVGYSGAEFDPNLVDIYLQSSAGKERMAEKGRGLVFDEAKAKKILEEKEIIILIEMNQGESEATAWGCDLSYDYVRINADYRS